MNRICNWLKALARAWVRTFSSSQDSLAEWRRLEYRKNQPDAEVITRDGGTN